MRNKRNPAKISSEDFFTTGKLLRKEFSKLVGCKEPHRIAIIPSVSYGMANVAHNVRLRPAEKIIVTGEQFPSNYYPWQRICADQGAKLQVISAPDTKSQRGKIWNQRILEAIDARTRIVALGNVHWTDGTLFNLLEIRKRTSEVGALLVVDGTQSVGALPFSMEAIQPDALVCAGYKWLLGPYSIGLAYYGPHFDGGNPIEESWLNRLDSEDFAGLVNYQDAYQAGAMRYDVGEHSNFILAPMMLQALRQINSWNPKNIQGYCARISKKAVDLLRENDFWIEDEAFRSAHLFGIRVPAGTDIKSVAANLKKKKISVSFRGDAIRVSPNVYNQEKDLMNLAKALLA